MPTHKLIAGFLALISLVQLTPVTLAEGADSYQQTFIISAYYSPKADQSVYFRGSFDADKKLNGNGTNGADGTPVYPGMLAAPKSYPFGTRLAIPGLGVGTVHDRGGAIVDAGVRSNAYDRIDVWMGEGEEGLARALAWGMRTVTATVYPIGSEMPTERFDLPTNLASLDGLKKTQAAANPLPTDLKSGDTGAAVTKLQTHLKTLGLLRGDITGTFDTPTTAAVTAYQISRRVIGSETDAGAGLVAGRTRELINAELNKKTVSISSLLGANALKSGTTTSAPKAATNSRFPTTLAAGDTGEAVRAMQTALAQLGQYDGEINGIYDTATVEYVTRFQESRGVVRRGEFGAGNFGPKTATALAAALDQLDKKVTAAATMTTLTASAAPGDSGATVTKLQEGLVKLGYYTGTPSGTLDSATQAALTKFQIDAGIITKAGDFGSGTFGPKTRDAFNTRMKTVAAGLPTAPTNPTWNRNSTTTVATSSTKSTTAPTPTPAVTTSKATTPAFTTNLTYGQTSAEVTRLQEALKKLGYLAGTPSGKYDDATYNAIAKLQIAAGVITKDTDYGVGTFGPKTRTALNSALAR